jgi:hypothetical protein
LLPGLERKLKSKVKVTEKMVKQKMNNTDELADNLLDLIKVKTINVALNNIYLRIIEVILS